MSVAFIKFDTLEDEARGVEELALRTKVVAFRGHVYAVGQEHLTWLDALNLPYRPATEREVEAARGSVRYPVAPLL